MKKFQVTINTTGYEKFKYFTELTSELSTMNDYMEALNGWSTTLDNLQEVKWQIELFGGVLEGEEYWDDDKNDYTDDYIKWKDKPENTITFIDKFCDVKRRSVIRAWYLKGFLHVDEIIEYLKENGVVRIPFNWHRDIRLYNKNPDNCYMEIKCIVD